MIFRAIFNYMLKFYVATLCLYIYMYIYAQCSHIYVCIYKMQFSTRLRKGINLKVNLTVLSGATSN